MLPVLRRIIFSRTRVRPPSKTLLAVGLLYTCALSAIEFSLFVFCLLACGAPVVGAFSLLISVGPCVQARAVMSSLLMPLIRCCCRRQDVSRAIAVSLVEYFERRTTTVAWTHAIAVCLSGGFPASCFPFVLDSLERTSTEMLATCIKCLFFKRGVLCPHVVAPIVCF